MVRLRCNQNGNSTGYEIKNANNNLEYIGNLGRWIMQTIGQNITQKHIIGTYEKNFLHHIVIEMLRIEQQQKKMHRTQSEVPQKKLLKGMQSEDQSTTIGTCKGVMNGPK